MKGSGYSTVFEISNLKFIQMTDKGYLRKMEWSKFEI